MILHTSLKQLLSVIIIQTLEVMTPQYREHSNRCWIAHPPGKALWLDTSHQYALAEAELLT